MGGLLAGQSGRVRLGIGTLMVEVVGCFASSSSCMDRKVLTGSFGMGMMSRGIGGMEMGGTSMVSSLDS